MRLKALLTTLIMICLFGVGTASAQVEVPIFNFNSDVGLIKTGSAAQPLALPRAHGFIRFRSRPGFQTEINWALLDVMDPARIHRLKVPDATGGMHEVVLYQSNYRAFDDHDWVGQIVGHPFSDVYISRYKNGFHAVFRDYETPRVWTIEGDAHGRFYVLDNESGLDPIGPVCDPYTSIPFVDKFHQSQGVSDHVGGRVVSDPVFTIDIMTVATQQVLLNVGANNFVAICRVAVSDFNGRASNSRVTGQSPGHVTLRLVAVDTVSGQDYSEFPSSQSDGATQPRFGGSAELYQLRIGQSPLSAEIEALRESCRADLVALCRWTPWRSTLLGQDTIGGVAYTPRSQAALDVGNEVWSVNAMNHATLNFVGDIFAHEVGHNLGLSHDFAQYLADINYVFDPGNPPPPASNLSSRPHGFKDACTAGCVVGDLNFHTTMAYGVASPTCGRSTLVPFFSSPEYAYDPGALCPSYVLGDTVLSWASELTLISTPTISQYMVGASLRWVAPGGTNGPGTLLDPLGSVSAAVSAVQGGADEAWVRIKSGVYDVDGTVVLNGAAKLTAEGGIVIIR